MNRIEYIKKLERKISETLNKKAIITLKDGNKVELTRGERIELLNAGKKYRNITIEELEDEIMVLRI